MSSAINHRKRSHRSEGRLTNMVGSGVSRNGGYRPTAGMFMQPGRLLRRIFQPAQRRTMRDPEEG